MLFFDGQIFFMGPHKIPGMAPLQIIWKAAKEPKPSNYGDSVVHLFSKPSRDAVRAMATSIQQVTQASWVRMDVEVFDLGRWADASALLRDGKADSMDQLRRRTGDVFRMFKLPWEQGVEELASCAALLLRDEADRPSRGIVSDNRIVWARVLREEFFLFFQ